MSHAAWDIYAEQLTQLGYGHPLWVPDPAPGRTQVEIGDVGWIEEGEFHVMFNALRGSDVGNQPWNALPVDFTPLDRAGLAIVGPRERISQTVLCSRSVQQRDFSGGLSTGPAVSPASGGVDFAFHCHGDSGALLMLSPYAMAHDILSKRAVVSYINANFDSWLEFAKNTLGLDLRDDDIRFVVGTKTTSRWAVAAFRGDYRNKQGSITGGLTGTASANISMSISDQALPASHYRVGPPERRLGEVPSRPSNARLIGHESAPLGTTHARLTELPFDQCIFVVTCKRKRRLQAFLQRLRARAGPDKLPRGPPEPGDPVAQSQEENADSDEEEAVDHSAYISSETAEYVIDPPPYKAVDPLDVLLDYILDHSDAHTAIASDTDLYELLEGRDWGSLPDIKRALKDVDPHVDVDQDGVGTIVNAPQPHVDPLLPDSEAQQSKPSRSRASSVASGRSSTAAYDFSSKLKGSAHIPAVEDIDRRKDATIAQAPGVWVQEKGAQHIPSSNEQGEDWIRTRERVAKATKSVLGSTSQVTHVLFDTNTDDLHIAPTVGLEEAARTLLNIWDAVQLIDVHRHVCLRLTERCATILMSILEEIAEAGDEAAMDLQEPISWLNKSFGEVHQLLMKQTNQPFIKGYLHRDEIQRALIGCHNSLSDALGMFSLSIRVRILKHVLHAEEQRRAEAAAHLDTLSHSMHPHQFESPPASPSTNMLQLAVANPVLDAGTEDMQHVLATIQAVTARQNERDMVYDADDLRELMRAALEASDDVEMIRILQIGREEMPEAIMALQRALDAEVERESRVAEQEETVVVTATVATPAGEAASSTRSVTIASMGSGQTSNSGSVSAGSAGGRSRAASGGAPRDTLDREFMETGIDALRRLSGAEVALPSWTITRYEVDREEKVGIGFFSDVYKGTWRGRTVAIKVLAETTPRRLFVHEVSIWKTLQHPNVLELLGASSASSDPPWFFVSPYYRNGSVVAYLKGLPSLDGVDLLKMIHQIAKGMGYLHGYGILHGDLKAANVLVDDRGHCIISDFGQSEMKSEVYRVGGMPLPHGTLRWQAPELMSGQSKLTQQVDVYAFAITCVELLTKGTPPWAMSDDDAVRRFVLLQDKRPELPLQHVWSTEFTEIMHSCWHRIPSVRPSFTNIDNDVQALRARFGSNIEELSISPELEQMHLRKSAEMQPIPLSLVPPDATSSLIEDTTPPADTSYRTAKGELPLSEATHPVMDSGVDVSEPFVSDRSRTSSRASSFLQDGHSERSASPRHLSRVALGAEQAQDLRNERRYRMLLQHEFHPSLMLPLWTPSQVLIGAVGYHSKATGGEFITLFNAFVPHNSAGGRAENIPPLKGVHQGTQRQDKRNVAQRGRDIIQSWLTSTRTNGDVKYSRRYSMPLRAGHEVAHLFTESTTYRYMEDLAKPKKWWKENVDDILAIYGAEHHIAKEDLYLVIGTLEAQNYALFVSHEHLDGQVDFNVFSEARVGQPWGEFSFSFDFSSSFIGDPRYDEPIGNPQWAQNISSYSSNREWKSMLLARLRFKPDQLEPTSL